MDKGAEEELELTYTGVFVLNKNFIIVSSIVDKFAEDNRDHAIVCFWFDNDWSHELIDDNSICGVVGIKEPKTKILAVGVDGRIDVIETGSVDYVEYVDQSDRGPNYSETLRCVKLISGRIYVAGMARQVYRRNDAGNWIQWDSGIFQTRNQRSGATGILDIDGFDSFLFAVGYKGEIWHCVDGKWIQEDSPTNLALTSVKCLSKDEVYIVGLSGTIIKGSHDNWRIIDQNQTSSDFWGIAEFNGDIYISSYEGLYILENDDLIPVQLGLDRQCSTGYLSSNDGVLWSVGSKDILCTEDGKTWHEIPAP